MVLKAPLFFAFLPRTHILLSLRNRGSGDGWRGGAIKTERSTFLAVSGCHFESNAAAGGGAIFHRGEFLAVLDSTFSQNAAKDVSLTL